MKNRTEPRVQIEAPRELAKVEITQVKSTLYRADSTYTLQKVGSAHVRRLPRLGVGLQKVRACSAAAAARMLSTAAAVVVTAGAEPATRADSGAATEAATVTAAETSAETKGRGRGPCTGPRVPRLCPGRLPLWNRCRRRVQRRGGRIRGRLI
jgi:hypothetical protein